MEKVVANDMQTNKTIPLLSKTDDFDEYDGFGFLRKKSTNEFDDSRENMEKFFNAVIHKLRINYSNSKQSVFRLAHKLTADETAIICTYIVHVLQIDSNIIYDRLPVFTRIRTNIGLYYIPLSEYTSSLKTSIIARAVIIAILQSEFACIEYVEKTMIMDKQSAGENEVKQLRSLIIDVFIRHFFNQNK